MSITMMRFLCHGHHDDGAFCISGVHGRYPRRMKEAFIAAHV